MALPTEADIPLILAVIRQNAAWGWKGGAKNDPTQVDWRDGVQTEPTLQELEDGWDLVIAAQANQETVRQQLKAEYTPLVGLTIGALTNAQARTLLEILCFIMGGIHNETRVLLPASQWQVAKELLQA